MLLMTAASSPARAGTDASAPGRDAMVEGALQCTRFFARYERELGIPTHLLSAIASTESGRYHKGLKIMLPWPWTVSSEGRGQYFDTKAQAIAAVKKMQASGVKNIDIGCMQVNLQHHGEHFATIEQAFEPEYNIAYAASFLRRLYDDSGVWKKAASDYHSKTPELGSKYISRVYDSWYGIIQKLREARLAVPSSSVTALNSMKTDSKVATSAAPAQVSLSNSKGTAKLEPYPAQGQPQVKVYAPTHERSISVSKVDDSATNSQATLSYVRRPVDKSEMLVVNATQPPQQAAARAVTVAPAVAAPAPEPAPAIPTAALPDTIAAPQIAPAPAIPVAVTPPVNVTPEAAPAVAQDNSIAPGTPPAPAPYVPPSAAAAEISSSAPLQAQVQHGDVSVTVPLSAVAQAAVMPVTGLVNAALRETQMAYAEPQQPAAPQPAVAELVPSAPAAPEMNGPRFIFSE